MSTLKILKREKDSMGDLPMEIPLRQERSYQLIKANAPYFWRNLLYLIFILVCISAILFYFDPFRKKISQKQYGYFEIHVFHTDGQPVVGAKIFNKKKQIGITDLYGQWRRFMKARPGSQITLQVQKDLFFEKKTFLMPQELGKTDKKHKFFAKINMPIRHIQSIVKENNATYAQKVMEKQNFYQNVWFYIDEDHIYSELESAIKIAQLKQYVLPYLHSISKKEGLFVERSSPWKIKITHLDDPITKDSPGVIHVSGRLYEKDAPDIDFLANYTGNGEKTAMIILNKIKNHVDYPYIVKFQKNKLYGIQPEADFWSIQSEIVLHTDENNKIQANSYKDMERFFRLENNSINFCKNKELECIFSRPFPALNLRIDILGYDESNDIYISGEKAKFYQNQTWFYKKFSDEKPYLTIVKGNKILERTIFSYQKEISLKNKNIFSHGRAF